MRKRVFSPWWFFHCPRTASAIAAVSLCSRGDSHPNTHGDAYGHTYPYPASSDPDPHGPAQSDAPGHSNPNAHPATSGHCHAYTHQTTPGSPLR